MSICHPFTFFLFLLLDCRQRNLTGESGSFTSPGYPRNYRNSLNCRYTITVPVGRLIQITFPIFDTESCCDRVTIYNVVGRTNVFAIRLSGSGKKTFKSKTNKVLLQFYTDSSVTRKGFVAYYTSAKGKKYLCLDKNSLKSHSLKIPLT